MKKETRCVHSGTYFDPATRGINTPIFTSSAYEYRDRADIPYPRYFNVPNQEAVIRKVCDLEGAEDGVLFSSGMAAISTAILAFVGAGDHVVMLDDLYGGSHAFAVDEFDRLGIAYTFVSTNAEAVRDAFRDETKLAVIESPTNPLLNVIDIAAVSGFAREKGVLTLIDNTFASPISQTPLALGIDIVVHSGTKYLGGHSDLCCGIAVSSREKTERILAMARHLGGSLNAETCYLLERSIKTLAIRVQRQTENAQHLAEFLNRRPEIRKVNYPGLTEFPGHEIARRQMEGFGAMLSFELDERQVDTTRFLSELRLIRSAVSLGGVETTICSPAETSHSKMSAVERERVGISDALLRLSVGIEQAEDLVEDIGNALKKGN